MRIPDALLAEKVVVAGASRAGILAIGDAVASYNPTYGQGMTMSSIQACQLRDVLASGATDLANRAEPGDRQGDLPGVDDERDR